jgi:hypothetical protein
MRAILTFMAMAMLVVSVGCDKKAATEPATPPRDSGGGPAEVTAPSAGETPAATDEAAPAATDEAAPAATDGAATSDTSETQTVSLKLPGMT